MPEPTIYTVGYQNVDRADLHAAADRLGLVVIDTRYSNRSRNPAWNGSALAKLLQGSYFWLPALGNVNYKTGGPIEIANLSKGIQMAQQYLMRGIGIILLCQCPNVETCHRRIVADALARASGCEVVHWMPADVKAAGQEILL